MRKIKSICIAILLAAAVLGTWALGHSPTDPGVAPATLDPFSMMLHLKDLPVHHIRDAV
jgi:hypothetical protein